MISPSEKKSVSARRTTTGSVRDLAIAIVAAMMMVIPAGAVLYNLPRDAPSEPYAGNASVDTSVGLKASVADSSSSQRSVDYRWYDMFNVPLGQWYNYRLSEEKVTNSYPYIYKWEGTTSGNCRFYSLLRLNVTAKNLTEINTSSMTQAKSMFIPHWGAVSGGNAVLDWTLKYLTTGQVNASWPSLYSSYDGWLIQYNANITLDKQAAMGMFGITEAQFDNVASFNTWWTNNKITKTNAYQGWLMSEGGPDHYWITPGYGSDMFLLGMRMDVTKVGDKALVKVVNVGWGMEMLVSRWLRYSFMPTEWYFDDFRMHAAIGPQTTNLTIDTGIQYGLYADETKLVPPGEVKGQACWIWQAMKQDYIAYPLRPDVAGAEHPNSEMNPYYGEKYMNSAPGSVWYGQWVDYDYTPGVFNLSAGETMSFYWPAGDIPFYESTGLGSYIIDQYQMTVTYAEPMSKDMLNLTVGGGIVRDLMNRTLTYAGPLDFFTWSKAQTSDQQLHDEWSRLGNHLLPRGCPYVEFRIGSNPDSTPYRLETSELKNPIVKGETTSLVVTCFDQYGNLYEGYEGTIRFSSNRSDVVLPSDHVFNLTDGGIHPFPLSFSGTGSYTVSVEDVSNPTLSASSDALVIPEPERIGHFTVECGELQYTNQPFDISVTAYDQFGLLFKRYNGTVTFSSSASPETRTLPPDYLFTEADGGSHLFANAASFESPGNFTISVADSTSHSATGTAPVSLALLPKTTYRVYDMFETPWREWWWQRTAYDVDIVLSNVSHQYTLLYNRDGSGMSGMIYAPYRFNVTAMNVATLNVDTPEFMPIMGPKDVAGAHADLIMHWEYLNWTWWNSYWAPTWEHDPAWIAADCNNTIMMMMGGDGYEIGVVYTIEMNREAALTWFNMSVSDAPADWWAANRSSYMSAWSSWIDYEANTRLDIVAGYDDIYYDLGELATMSELPDGNVSFTLVHFSWGFEVLTTRWLEDARICEHSTYMEDFTMTTEYREESADVQYDAVCQWNLHAVKANQSAEGAAWVWEPMKIDHVTSGSHSDYIPWSTLAYADWNAGDPNYGQPLGSPTPYETTPLQMNLTSNQKLIIQLPMQKDVIGYQGVSTGWDSIFIAYAGDLHDFEAITLHGEMSLGYCMTGGVDLMSMYNGDNKTLTIQGPVQFDNHHWWPGGPIYHGAPWIEFNITPVQVPVLQPLADVQCRVGDEVEFVADVGGTTAPLQYTWYFGDGYNFLGNPATHSYFGTGVYLVGVTVSDGQGFVASSNAVVTVLPASYGWLRVTTNPAVPSLISVDGEWRSLWGIDWLPISAGYHTVSFGKVIGYASPLDETVLVQENKTAYVIGNFTQLALLQVRSSPSVPSSIYVDGIARNDGPLNAYVSPGQHTIAWGPVADYAAPAPVVVTLGPGETRTLTGNFTSSPSSPGPEPSTFGCLRVQTVPAVPTTISVDGNWMNMWGLDWVKLWPGTHFVSFSPVPGFATHNSTFFEIVAGSTTNLVMEFTRLGSLHVKSDPALPVTIFVDGVARSTWGLWVDILPSMHSVSFGGIEGLCAPFPEAVWVVSGDYKEVTGWYLERR